MKHFATNSRSAALISFILALPLAILFPIAVFEIEPFNTLLKRLLTGSDGYQINALGRGVEGVAMLLLPVAFIVNLVPIVRNLRAGNSITATPINLSLAAALLLFVAVTWGWALVDQIPCFMGVPNCD
ncbi:MAG: hypothetical protein H7Z16_13900 [Pyrinomonadaceae bacterium]|nr:hypothetical protein [Pyrinomonadaceae bacterium]